MTQPRVASLHLYPVKGARAIDVDAAHISVEGVVVGGVGDREWMLVDSDGRFITQRSHHRLALIDITIGERHLQLSVPGGETIRVALDARRTAARDVIVWRSAVRGFDEGDQAAAAVSRFLGQPLRLVRFDPALPRLCNPDFAGDSGAHTRYADGYPVLIIGAASLRDLNARLLGKGATALPMNRFRPNIVVDGIEAFDEDHIDTLTINGIVMKMVKPCIRCIVTTIDQASAAAGEEPLLTLSGYRQHATLGGIHFGMNAIIVRGAGGRVSAGDTAQIEWTF
ncbi:MAG: MOSC N-terminal beta barrel domain-containing protein [Casimicrobiaceae bacterium]